ncbi:hypothetical protein NECAME_13829 [Necator americanus]|uniref:Uncharacterized protein n=1 Tax=Necator americanus TaxID=51031 RepID=W2SSB6_NECAM|nr:hypothetical protein NECAME_13829 [Necator americanus]ETN72520.1 hypothetical protein NECAME_13829 [Necator americanus]
MRNENANADTSNLQRKNPRKSGKDPRKQEMGRNTPPSAGQIGAERTEQHVLAVDCISADFFVCSGRQ